MKKFVVIFLMLSLVVQLFSIQLFALQTEEVLDSVSLDNTSERKLYFNENDNSEFADDAVLVVFNNSESLQFKTYSKNDFANINVKQIDDLSSASKNLVRTKVEHILSQISSKSYFADLTDRKNITSLDVKKYNQIIRIKLEETGREKVISAIKELEKRDDVLLACPDYYIMFEETSYYELNDKFIVSEIYERTSNESRTNDPFIDLQWALEQINVFSAWDYVNTEETVLVGVMDSGIDGTHEDLDDVINFELCRDFTYETPNVETAVVDSNGHGTQVAGIIAAEINNTKGISGVSPNVGLVSLKMNYGAGEANSACGFIRALNYASSANIKIINASVAWYRRNQNDSNNQYEILVMYKSLFEQAIENYDGLIICGAANMGKDIDNANGEAESYPSEFDCENILSVGASDRNENRCYTSCFGAQSVDLFAPGVLNISCLPFSKCGNCEADNPNDAEDEREHYSNGYHFFNQTSSATPFVTGVASMLLAKYPYMTPSDLKQTIMMNVDVIVSNPNEGVEGLEGLCVTGGRLNAYKAMTNPMCQQHEIECLSVDSQTHKYVCQECGYITVESENHILGEYINYTSTTHIRTCIYCTYTKQSFHRWETDAVTGETKCKFCNAT